ncbi:MAG: 16S rRNA (guanine(966)-N(2))-methyltransferase RsmD [Gammaproteobacteria bacterium]|nr:16S rRNA (guanine(966)-N(2))-methyltransferase RsmD [Gammaproteobacteria bacterium]MDH5802475.1 16S rRNA (guanine(966)-N(2))-methyltransferase RsmD [Gammaproteobacteria bacterium]
MAAKHPNSLRIIAGQWRGRKLHFPSIEGLRPTPDRVRETLYNWLQNHIANLRVLDCFAGSGALGLEALSRGAAHCTFAEQNRDATRAIEQHLHLLQCDRGRVLSTDVLNLLKQPAPQAFDLVLLDPPFRKNLIEPCLQRLQQNHWLQPQAWIYLECEKELTPLPLPSHWELYRSKQAGQVSYHLIRTHPPLKKPT